MAIHVHQRAQHDIVVGVSPDKDDPVDAGAHITVTEHSAGLNCGGERVGIRKDAVSAGEHGPEGLEGASGKTRAEEGGQYGGVRDDIAVRQVVERPERVREVPWEADVEGEEGVGDVAVGEESRARGAGVQAVPEAG